MPIMTITTVDGAQIKVDGSPALQTELDRYEKAIDNLLPGLEGGDDAVGEQALTSYNTLAAQLNKIVDQLPAWNKILADENRSKRRAVAASIRERRRGN